MEPPEQPLQHAGRRLADAPVNEQLAQRAADDYVGLRAGAALGHVESVRQDGGGHKPGDHADDDDGVGVAGQVKAQPPRLHHPAAGGGPYQHHQQHRRQDVEVAAVHHRAGLGEQPFRERLPCRRAEYEYGVGQHESEESPENRRVAQSGPVAERHPLQHLFLPQHDCHCAGQPLHRPVESRLGPALQDEPEHPLVDGKTARCRCQQEQNVNAHPDGNGANVAGRYHYLFPLVLESRPGKTCGATAQAPGVATVLPIRGFAPGRPPGPPSPHPGRRAFPAGCSGNCRLPGRRISANCAPQSSIG